MKPHCLITFLLVALCRHSLCAVHGQYKWPFLKATARCKLTNNCNKPEMKQQKIYCKKISEIYIIISQG